jgi:hypothetical protein
LLIALAATLGALFIGEVLGQMPCTLCWYQRIAMFPLVPILGLSLWLGDGMARAYHPVVQDIRRQFPDQVPVALRYVVFHEGSDKAVRILAAARMQDRFEPVLDALLEQQPGWAVHRAPQRDVAWEIAGGVSIWRGRKATGSFRGSPAS